MHDPLEAMSRIGLVALTPEDEKLDQPTGIRNSAAVARRSRELVRELEGEAAHVHAHGRYTSVGAAAVLGEAAIRFLGELTRLRTVPMAKALADRDKRRAELTTAAVADGDGVADVMLRHEARGLLRQLGDALLINERVLAAVAAGDKVTVAAVLETAGTIFALLPEPQLRELRQAWARKMAPAAAAELARVEAACDEALRTLAAAEGKVREIGKLEIPDAIERVARGEPPVAA